MCQPKHVTGNNLILHKALALRELNQLTFDLIMLFMKRVLTIFASGVISQITVIANLHVDKTATPDFKNSIYHINI